MRKNSHFVDIAEVLPRLQDELSELTLRQRKLQHVIDIPSAEARLGRRQYLLMKEQNRDMIAYMTVLMDRVNDIEERLAARAAGEETK